MVKVFRSFFHFKNHSCFKHCWKTPSLLHRRFFRVLGIALCVFFFLPKSSELRGSGSYKYIKPMKVLGHNEFSAFLVNTQKILPTYLPIFQLVGEEFNISWKFLAAVGYQESLWNPQAKSFTGVKGLMMLTRETSRFVGIKNRQDPQQSIWGGAKYLNYLNEMLPQEIPESQRIHYVLAAYNLGPGHLADAMSLAEKFNLDPLDWKQFKKVLPLLSQEKYYHHLRYGPARGYEALSFVKKTLAYEQLLNTLYPHE